MTKPLRIAICMTTPPDSYSGGRYAAVALAEAIALGGHETWLVANHRPLCLDDFATTPGHARVQFQHSRDFRRNLPEGRFDLVILIPSTGVPVFGERVTVFAIERGARLVLYNFETPNWCNSLTSIPRDPADWAPWRRAVVHASAVLSISAEADRWARDFYGDVATNALFAHSYPPINTPVADATPQGAREKRYVVFMRFSSADHKGSGRIPELLDESMRGGTLVFILGKEEIPNAIRQALERRAQSLNVALEYRHRIADREKFQELKRARLLLFPSEFEGYGYPPVEALYAGTPGVAFDLPVLRETCGDALHYAAPGDWPGFRKQIKAAEESTLDATQFARVRRSITPLDRASDSLEKFLRDATTAPLPLETERTRHAARLRRLDAVKLLDTRARWRLFLKIWRLRLEKRLPFLK